MKEFIEKLIGRLEEHIKYCEMCHKEFPNAKMSLTYEVQLNAYKNAIEIVNELATEYKNTNIITNFLQYARDNADNYDTNEGWSLADLIDLSIKFTEEYINTSTDTSSGYCEWKPIDEEKSIYKSVCKKQSLYDGNPTESMYEFCPYCGKKIKVVE